MPTLFLLKCLIYSFGGFKTMSKFQIITDSCSDLCREDREKYHLDYARMNVVVDGVEKVADLDWAEFTPEEFYGWLEAGRKMKTTQVPLTEFIDRCTPYLEKGIDILYISCSSKLSGSINIFELAKEQLLEQFPERKLIGVDSLNACFGEGLLAIQASLRQDEGMSIEEVAKWAEEHRNDMVQFATVETLDYIQAAGRITQG